ncbi:hypothetical protein BDY21DRAFT_392595 [Lineolata rhizophorae]|uniref:Zn(2)-C6 fungal-type domain-containing protein n=1 Tax=Lineolata rhizophorae TaxID=578093 RepID=A0A6A6P0I0_9PEZI|nr:hypothetical protein BDY21DRAFT_392595 [Lineolata rhizophorae]
MAKRSWSLANSAADETDHATSTPPRLFNGGGSNGTKHGTQQPYVPRVSRKVKACAACRKQKIKCLMENGPPCRRCTERNLSCVLNKSLQTLLDERSQWKETVSHDLDHMHSALQGVLKHFSLPLLPPLESHVLDSDDLEVSDDIFDQPAEPPPTALLPSCDSSPRILLQDDALPNVPIESLYQITRPRSLGGEVSDDDKYLSPASANRDGSISGGPGSQGSDLGPIGGVPSNSFSADLVSKSLLSSAEASRLVDLYLGRLDHFMYRIGGAGHSSLSSLRGGGGGGGGGSGDAGSSPILTAAMCTVAALHDPASNHLYESCSSEFRRLLTASMWERGVDKAHLRAMCIGSYWLSDISWTLSGAAIRRAMEVNLNANLYRLDGVDCSIAAAEDAADCLRIWYILWICDQHLATLYGRPAIVREDYSVKGWERLLRSPVATEDDRRMISQVALLNIVAKVRETFGPDKGERVPVTYAGMIADFGRQLDRWFAVWHADLKGEFWMQHHDYIGRFPRRGVQLHYHFAKLHLYSHVFRGLTSPSSYPAPHSTTTFHPFASAAVSSATAILNLLLTDADAGASLAGVPHYLHTMSAFACVFLVKLAAKFPPASTATSSSSSSMRVVGLFRQTRVGRAHLVHLMADGLEKLAVGLLLVRDGSGEDAPGAPLGGPMQPPPAPPPGIDLDPRLSVAHPHAHAHAHAHGVGSHPPPHADPAPLLDSPFQAFFVDSSDFGFIAPAPGGGLGGGPHASSPAQAAAGGSYAAQGAGHGACDGGAAGGPAASYFDLGFPAFGFL